MFESLSRSMFERTSSRQRRLAERRRSTSLRPMVEGLEDRVVLSTIVWNTAVAPSGGDWDTDGNWVGNSKPKSGDTAQINLTSAGTVTHLTGVSDSVLNVSTNALTTLSVDSGTLTLGAAPSQVNGPVTVGFSGTLQLINTTLFGQGTLTVGGQMKAHTGAALLLSSTTINTGATLTVGNFSIGTSATLTFQQYANMFVTVGSTVGLNGTTSFATGDTVTIATDFSNRITQVLVSSSSTGGSLSAVGTTFTGTGGYTTNLLIGAAGHFTAASCTFALSELYLDDGSVYGAGDLTGNNFGMPILVPYNDVKNLANNARFTDININPGTISSGTLALNAIGTNTASLRYVFPAGFTVATGGTLSVGPNVPVLLSPGQTLTVNGTASFATGDAVTLATDFNNRTAQILVSSNSTGGTLSAVGTTFTGTGGYTTSISVGAAGHFTAANSTFSLSSLSLDDSSVYGAGDLTGDNFGMPIYVPYNDVKNLANNAKFTDININAGTISSGTLALNLIGINTANLRYVFPNGFTVGTGGTMNVAANVSVLVPFGQALTVNGTASFATGDTVTLATDFNNRTAQILVSSNSTGGTLSAVGTTFTGTGGYTANISVGAAGHFAAANSTFAITGLYLDNASIYGAGDLTGDNFGMPIYVPYNDVQYLSGNAKFTDININAGTISSGILALNLIGTNTASLRYVFPAGFTVATGGTLSVGPNVPVLVPFGQALTVNGTASFATGDTVTLATDFNNRTAQILVSSNSTGGTLSAVGTTFTGTGGYTANISVGAAGHFSAANSTFAITGLYLDNASIYGAGDLTGDNFGMPIYVPYNDVKNLANNARFTDININAGTIGTGALALNAIGTNTASLRYVFPGNFTVGAGATVSVAPNLPVQILAGATLTVNGTLSFGLGDVITFSPAPSSASIAVGNGGLLSASGVAFNTDNTSYTTQVSVNSGGKLVLSSSTYNLSNLNLNSGSNDTLGSVVFKGVMTINSAATLSVAQNDFSGLGANGIVAVGDSQATINLKNNYWGTSVTSVIDTKILDHIDSAATRPTVVYAPIVKGTSGITAASVSTTFSYAAQDVTLTAIVTDAAANRINEGTVTFNVLSGSTPIGASATSNTVANGIASATYHLPASTLVGGYTIQAIYNDDSALGNYLSVTDAAHTLTVAKVTAPSVAIDSNRSIIYSDISNQTVHLIATVTSAAGVVNEGSITFNIRSGGTTIGQIVPNVPVAVVGGVGTATADYVLPLGTPGGLFTIEADYSGSSNLNPATDISKTLHISQADTTTTPSSATTTYSINTQNVTLTSSVTSLAGTINEGTVTFNVYKLDGLTILGTTTSSRVDNGLATAHFSLDAKTPKGSYSIVAMYNGTNNYAPSIDDPPTLTVDPAPSSTSASNVTATFNPIDQTVSVRADITSGVDLVSEGSVVFTLLKGTTPIVTSGPIAVTSGVASTILTLTGGTSADTYTVRAAYSGSNYVASTSDGTLALGQKTPTITWADPSDIVYGTPLSGTQLNAKASVAGGISYSSPVGTILGVGSTQALTASFTPTDTTNYKVAATTVHINVLKANPVFSLLTASQSIVYGQAAIGVSGKLAATTAVPFNDSLTITIGSASGTALVQADGTFSTSIDTHAISASATSYTVNYSFAGDGNFVATNDVTTSLTVARATPPITWADPSDIVFGTLLSGTQLNASTSVAGSFSYSPAVGARPNAGNGQILSATFTPTDTTNYLTVPGTVHLNVLRAQPIFSLLTASQSIAYGKSSIDVTGKLAATSAIPAGQLVTIAVGSTTASVMVQADGTFSATIDTHALNASATPYPITYGYSATTNFQLAGDATTTLTVTKVGQTITLNDLPAAAAYGTIIHTKPTSTSGLPIILAPTNCTVKSTADGGFDITIGSGTNAAIVVATQSGDGNTNPAESVIVTITAQKAAATVTLSGTSATYDGSPHFASTTTTPIGRTVNLAYDQGGVPVTSPTAAGSYHVTATISDADYAGTASATLTIARATPVLNWSNPAAITFGTALSSTQLNASSSVPGSFVYNPVSGTRPNTGNNQTLSATFTPTDTVNYNSTSATATINVVQAQPIFSQLTASQAITYGMSSISVAGKLAAGAVVPAAQTVTITLNGVATTATVQSDGTFGATLDTSALNASATPYTITYGFATTTNFLAAANGSTTVTVGKATQTVSFLSVPTGGVFGTTVIARPVSSSGLPIILTPTNCSFVSRADGGYDVTLNGGAGTATLVATAQVNSNYLNATPVTATIVVTKATASVSLTGLSAVYNGSVHLAGATTTPANLVVVVGYKQGGVVVASPTNAGAYDVTATVNDPNYQGTATDTLAIGKATPILTWSSPSDVPFGTPLSTTVQLNATANVPGNLDYGSQPGMVLGLGSHPLTASFTPLDTTNYSSQPVTTTINVTPAHPVFSGLTASQTITSGKPTIDVAGKLAATPPEIPAGNTVTITVGASQKTATIQADGTFSATLDTSALNASATAYAITYSYAATTSFLAATDTSTKLTVGKASQAVSFLIAPPSGVYGTKVIVRPTSTSGLPIILTPTNCSLTPRADGGYDVTLDGGVGTATVTAASSADINHLDAPQVTATIAVTKATASVSLNGLSAVYNGSVHVAGATTTPAGLAVNLVYKQGGVVVASPTNAGAYDVTATVNDPNYQGAATDTLVIARATPILAWSPPGDIVLGTALSDSQLDATSLVAGTFDYGSQGGTVLGTGGHVLSVSFTPSDLGNYVKTGASTTLNVTPAHPVFSQLTASQTITYGKPTIGIAGKLAATPPEIPAGDTVTITVGSSQMTATVQADGTFSATIDTHALAASATPYTISYSSAAGASFLAASDTSTRLTVGKAHLTVIPADQAKTYDGAALTGFASTFSGFVNGETFLSSGITGQPGFGGPAVGAVNVGSYDASINSVAALSAANYDFSASAVTAHLLITIASAAVTVDPSSLSQTYDGSIKTVKATTTPAGLALKSVFTQNGVAATPAQAGTYLVTETINDPNYQGTQTATLTIARASQAITITGAPAGAAFNQTFNVRPTSTSGLPVLLTGTNCRVVGLADGSYDVTMTSGTAAATLTASQAGDANFNAAAPRTVTISAQKAPATVTLSGLTFAFDGSAHSASATTSPAGLAVTFAYAQGGVAVAKPNGAGDYAVTATINDLNYEGGQTGTLTISKPSAPPQATGASAAHIKKNVSSITITFDMDLKASSATNPGAFSVFGVVKKGKKTTLKSLGIGTPIYNASAHSVTLTLAKSYKGAVKVTVLKGIMAATGATSQADMPFTVN